MGERYCCVEGCTSLEFRTSGFCRIHRSIGANTLDDTQNKSQQSDKIIQSLMDEILPEKPAVVPPPRPPGFPEKPTTPPPQPLEHEQKRPTGVALSDTPIAKPRGMLVRCKFCNLEIEVPFESPPNRHGYGCWDCIKIEEQQAQEVGAGIARTILSVFGIFWWFYKILRALADSSTNFSSTTRAISGGPWQPAQQPVQNQSTLVATWTCINGHTITSKRIESRCPFCGGLMSQSR